jgi:hypothetical protein
MKFKTLLDIGDALTYILLRLLMVGIFVGAILAFLSTIVKVVI